MMLSRLLIVCLCGIVSFSYFAQCAAAAEGALKKDSSATTTVAKGAKAGVATAGAAPSAIYKIKRLDAYDTASSRKEQKRTKQQEQQMLLTKPGAPLEAVDMTTAGGTNNKSPHTKKVKNSAKNSHGLNKKLLNKLGFTKVKAPNSHNRKRLAIESRRHASADDSHMFIIKLPPNLYYYASPGASSTSSNGVVAAGSHSSGHTSHGHGNSKIGADANPHNALLPPSSSSSSGKEVLNANGKKVSFPFSSNGKPGRIYHWNLPAIKKMLEDKQRFAGVATATKDQLIDIKDTPTWTRPWENETYEKSYGKSANLLAPSGPSRGHGHGGGGGGGAGGNGSASYKKSLKRKSPTYYAPANAVNKNSFNKYFAGNGKPKGFYVIKENQKKPLYYRNIVS